MGTGLSSATATGLVAAFAGSAGTSIGMGAAGFSSAAVGAVVDAPQPIRRDASGHAQSTSRLPLIVARVASHGEEENCEQEKEPIRVREKERAELQAEE